VNREGGQVSGVLHRLRAAGLSFAGAGPKDMWSLGRDAALRASRRTTQQPAVPMLNRSAVVIGHAAAFYGWLKTGGIASAAIEERRQVADRVVYLIPACHYPEEIDEVVEDLFEEIFRRELRRWQPDEKVWPDTADFDLFTRWFTVEGFSLVEDAGRGDGAHEA
jgi:hypothetical protein